MAVVGTDLLGGRVLDVEHVGLDVQSVGGLNEHAAQLATTEDSNLGRVPHDVGSKDYMTQLFRICKREIDGAPQLRKFAESHVPLSISSGQSPLTPPQYLVAASTSSASHAQLTGKCLWVSYP